MLNAEPNRVGTREGPAAEMIGGPFDGDLAGLVPGGDVVELRGHLYRLRQDDTGARYWEYIGFAVVGGG